MFYKFFEWPDYLNFKTICRSEKGEDIEDHPCRTLFLSTRCKGLTLPKREQCACKIHTQQDLYLEALREVTVQGRDATVGGAAPKTEIRNESSCGQQQNNTSVNRCNSKSNNI